MKELLVEFVRRVDGVVGVDDRLTFETDDRKIRAIGPYGPFGWAESWVAGSR